MVGEEDSSNPLQMTISRSSGLDVNKPKHGKVVMDTLVTWLPQHVKSETPENQTYEA